MPIKIMKWNHPPPQIQSAKEYPLTVVLTLFLLLQYTECIAAKIFFESVLAFRDFNFLGFEFERKSLLLTKSMG